VRFDEDGDLVGALAPSSPIARSSARVSRESDLHSVILSPLQPLFLLETARPYLRKAGGRPGASQNLQPSLRVTRKRCRPGPGSPPDQDDRGRSVRPWQKRSSVAEACVKGAGADPAGLGRPTNVAPRAVGVRRAVSSQLTAVVRWQSASRGQERRRRLASDRIIQGDR
jgi:hypothetical protein